MNKGDIMVFTTITGYECLGEFKKETENSLIFKNVVHVYKNVVSGVLTFRLVNYFSKSKTTEINKSSFIFSPTKSNTDMIKLYKEYLPLLFKDRDTYINYITSQKILDSLKDDPKEQFYKSVLESMPDEVDEKEKN